MKRLIKTIRRVVAGVFAGVAIATAAASAHAQMPLFMVNSSLTNALSFNPYSLNGATNISAGGTLNVSSQPFYIWRGRGFSLTEAFTPASSSTEGITNAIQFATVTGPVGNPTSITNWLSSPILQAVFFCNGTARVVASTNFTASQVDNFALGRLLAITNLGTVVVSVDPTNTYTSVFP